MVLYRNIMYITCPTIRLCEVKYIVNFYHGIAYNANGKRHIRITA